MQFQFVSRQRLAKIVGQQRALLRFVLQFGREETELPAPAILGSIESKVGRGDEDLTRVSVMRRNCNSDRGADDRPFPLE